MYEPILEFKASELIARWTEIYELLSVEKLSTTNYVNTASTKTTLWQQFDLFCNLLSASAHARIFVATVGNSGFDLRFHVAVQLTAGTFGGTAMVREAVHVWN